MTRAEIDALCDEDVARRKYHAASRRMWTERA
jgi:hypothetical protein